MRIVLIVITALLTLPCVSVFAQDEILQFIPDGCIQWFSYSVVDPAAFFTRADISEETRSRLIEITNGFIATDCPVENEIRQAVSGSYKISGTYVWADFEGPGTSKADLPGRKREVVETKPIADEPVAVLGSIVKDTFDIQVYSVNNVRSVLKGLVKTQRIKMTNTSVISTPVFTDNCRDHADVFLMRAGKHYLVVSDNLRSLELMEQTTRGRIPAAMQNPHFAEALKHIDPSSASWSISFSPLKVYWSVKQARAEILGEYTISMEEENPEPTALDIPVFSVMQYLNDGSFMQRSVYPSVAHAEKVYSFMEAEFRKLKADWQEDSTDKQYAYGSYQFLFAERELQGDAIVLTFKPDSTYWSLRLSGQSEMLKRRKAEDSNAGKGNPFK